MVGWSSSQFCVRAACRPTVPRWRSTHACSQHGPPQLPDVGGGSSKEGPRVLQLIECVGRKPRLLWDLYKRHLKLALWKEKTHTVRQQAAGRR